MTIPTSTSKSTTTTTTPDGAPFIDADGFAARIERSQGLALVDFTADHCPPCRVLAPQLDSLARELSGRAFVAKVDVDAEPALTARFGIRGTPTLIVFRDGEIVERIVGIVPMSRLRAALAAAG